MRAGQLRHPITIQKLGARVDDGMGGGSIPWDDLANLNAAIEPLDGEERLLAGQYDASLSHRVRTRFVPGVRPHHRVRYLDEVLVTADNDGFRYFDIKEVIDEEERHRQLELMCTELVTW